MWFRLAWRYQQGAEPMSTSRLLRTIKAEHNNFKGGHPPHHVLGWHTDYEATTSFLVWHLSAHTSSKPSIHPSAHPFMHTFTHKPQYASCMHQCVHASMRPGIASMHVCTYALIYVCMHVRVYAHAYTNTDIRAYMHTLYTRIHAHTHRHIHAHACKHTCTIRTHLHECMQTHQSSQPGSSDEFHRAKHAKEYPARASSSRNTRASCPRRHRAGR